MVLSLSGCGGCDLVILKLLVRLGLEPTYFKMMVEEVEIPPRITTLIVTGFIVNDEQRVLLERLASRAERVILAGCCALNGGLYAARGLHVTPPSRLLAGYQRAPGCPVIPEVLASLLRVRRPRGCEPPAGR